jgi:hypothetical protein
MDRAGPKRALQLLRDVNYRESDIEISWIPDPLRSLEKTTFEIGDDTNARLRTLITRKPLQLGEPGQLVLRQSLYREEQYLSSGV